MPSNEQVLKSINSVLLGLKKAPADSLMHDYITDGETPCTNFGPALLESILTCGFSENYSNNSSLDPHSSTGNGTFLNYMVIGDPSEFNHNFCVYVSDNEAKIIQMYQSETNKYFEAASPF